MFGQPASSQTVCRPSRRTRDFSSVYSGPVFRRVLIHSGLRSMGTWLLRTSRRSSLRPAGSSGEPEECAGAAVSLMISTVPPTHDAPVARSNRGAGSGEAGSSGLVATLAGGLAGVAGRGLVALGELGGLLAQVAVGRRAVAGRALGAGHGLLGIGHGVLSVTGHRTVAGGSRGPAVVLPAAQPDGDGGTHGEEREHPWPPLPRLLHAGLPLHLLGGVGRLLGELAPLLAGDLARLLRRL